MNSDVFSVRRLCGRMKPAGGQRQAAEGSNKAKGVKKNESVEDTGSSHGFSRQKWHTHGEKILRIRQLCHPGRKRENPAVRIRRHFFLLLSASILLTLAVPIWLSGWSGFAAILHLPWWAALLMLAMMVFSWTFNTLRVRHLARALGTEVGFGEGALIVMATEFAGSATPASAGMPATYSFLLGKHGLKLGHAMGMVTVLVILDLTFFALLMSMSSLALAFSGVFNLRLQLVGLSVLILVGGSFLFWGMVRYHRRIFHFLGRLMGRVPWLVKYRYPLARITVEFILAVRILGRISLRRRLTLFLATCCYWLPRYSILAVGTLMVSRAVPLAYLYLVQGLLNLGGQALFLPSGGGGVDAAFSALMHPYLIHKDLAFVLIVWRSYTFYWYLVVGGPIFLLKTGQAARWLLTRAHRPT
jgi:uncharacterized protein (TIRG00374 family)